MNNRVTHTLAILSSAILLIVSFPKFSFFPAAFVALAPILYVNRGLGIKAALYRGFAAAFLGYAGIFYWLYPMLIFNTGSLFQSLLCVGLLSAYLALYVGIWSALSELMRFRFPWVIAIAGSSALWVSLEYARTWLLTGFPWAILGYSQWNFLPAAQIAEYTGVLGVSFLCVLVNLVLADMLAGRKLSRGHSAVLSCVIVLLIAGVFRHSTWQKRDAAAPTIRVALLQGNIDQYKKWDEAWENEILTIFERLQRKAASFRPDIIIWPETSVPGYLPGDLRLMKWMESHVSESGTWNIVSAPFVDTKGSYNSSILFDPRGNIRGVHRKTHLIPFGEYVPFRRLLEPFFGVLNALGDFTRGIAPVVLSGDSWRAGPSICSENFYSDVSRMNTANGATIIINQTNDAWFFRTAAPFQHFAMNVFRAIETRRPVAVCGNTGVTGTVAASGDIGFTAPIFTTECYIADIHPHTEITPYVRFGDAFAKLCVLIALSILVFSLKKRTRELMNTKTPLRL